MISGFSGFDKVSRNLNKLAKKAQDVNPKVLKEIGEDCKAKAIPYTPIDMGDLRASGQARMVAPTTVRVEFTESYALKMHEDMTYRPSEPGTGPKYLTRALQENEQRYRRRIIEVNQV